MSKKNPSRRERRDAAITDMESGLELMRQGWEKIEAGKGAIEELRDELQNWLDSLPENLQSGDLGSRLQEAIEGLDQTVEIDESSSIDEIEQGMAGSIDVAFPGMYGR